MGYMRHHAIIVTDSSRQNGLEELHLLAVAIFGAKQVSHITSSPLNNYESFFVAPDGSKEGWEDSDKGDEQRERFVIALQQENATFVQVMYGDDNGHCKIINHS